MQAAQVHESLWRKLGQGCSREWRMSQKATFKMNKGPMRCHWLMKGWKAWKTSLMRQRRLWKWVAHVGMTWNDASSYAYTKGCKFASWSSQTARPNLLRIQLFAIWRKLSRFWPLAQRWFRSKWLRDASFIIGCRIGMHWRFSFWRSSDEQHHQLSLVPTLP